MIEAREAILQDRFYHDPRENWTDVCERAARSWSHDLTFTGRAYEVMRNRLALPNTPALANAGRKHAMGSACFVLPIDDSLVNDAEHSSSIMQTLMDAAAVHKSGGGTGFDFSRIRASGTPVASTGRGAPGPVNVLQLYSDAIGRVTQAGMRPGANMGILRVDHPDALAWVSAKRGEQAITNFNISLAATDAFMSRVKSDRFHGEERALWRAIIDGAWENGEPGLFFVDTVNKHRLHPEPIEATNPCGEVPLRPYEACVLGSINLAEHVDEFYGLNMERLRDTVRTMVELLDNVIDMQAYPLERIEQEQKRYRKIGLGVMGFHEMLMKLGVRYSSAQAVDLAEMTMEAIADYSHEWSHHLGINVRGVFPGYHEAGMGPNLAARNLMTNVIAPTGTIARLALTHGFGIEPFFDVNEEGRYSNFICKQVFEYENPWHRSPVFETASDIPWRQHVQIQAAFQRYTDQAVSKTLNLPADATREDIADAFVLAWETGCKGTTVLRAESREDTVLSTDCVGGTCAL
jgi:ribonucleoside-diphosphate reductase alpha chain